MLCNNVSCRIHSLLECCERYSPSPVLGQREVRNVLFDVLSPVACERVAVGNDIFVLHMTDLFVMLTVLLQVNSDSLAIVVQDPTARSPDLFHSSIGVVDFLAGFFLPAFDI